MNEMKMKVIKITFPDGSQKNVSEGITLLKLKNDYQKNFSSEIIAAKVNQDIKELSYQLKENCDVEFIDLTNDDGVRIYRRSLQFILVKAVNDLFPDREVRIEHSLGKGIFCEIRGNKELEAQEVREIEARMHEIVAKKIPFEKNMISTEEAKKKFNKNGREDKFHAIEYREKPYVTIYRCDGHEDYFYGYMAPDTGYIQKFALLFYQSGVIMTFPEKTDPNTLPEFKDQKKLFSIFKEYKRWGHILGVDNTGDLNDIIKAGDINSFIRVSEALHEKKISQIADMILGDENKKRIVLISGPSSSGKTTFAQRLSIQLRVNGIQPITISLDDYFVDRTRTPIDENGEYDYEALEAIDIELFNQHLSDLIKGKEVNIPIFNFHTGMKEDFSRKLQMRENQILIIEGIHGLNEKLTAMIPKEIKFKIYVSALTSLNIDDHNRIPTTDGRILRRIVRDYQFRNNTATDTIKRWPSVRRGEELNIFPFQEEADIMFNSSLVYELGVLKNLAEPHLLEVSNCCPEYAEARRLIEFLSYFLPIDAKEIPTNSIIREFVGGSCF